MPRRLDALNKANYRGALGWAGSGPTGFHFPLLDALRGFAAISVVVYHVIKHFQWSEFPISGPLVWFRIGGLGVDLFFVISGFVISLSAFQRIDANLKGGFIWPFAVARATRIVPLHYLTCTVFLIFVEPNLVLVPDIWKQVLSHTLFVHNWFLTHQGGINGVNWSVAAEMQFYILIAFTARWLRNAPWRLVLLLAVTISWSWRALSFYMVTQDGAWGTFPVFVYSTQLPGTLDEFVIGILLARALLSPKGAKMIIWLNARPYIALGSAITVGGLALKIYWWNSTYWNSAAMVIGFKSLLAVACGLIILITCLVRHDSVIWVTSPLRYLGVISYGIYLWHLPVILALKRVTWLNGATALPWVLGLTIFLASASWHYFEQPFIRRNRSKVH